MSEEKSPAVVEKDIAEKRKAWADTGEKAYKILEELQLRAQKTILSIKIPKTFAEVLEAESTLKQAKKDQQETKSIRLAFTKRFTDFVSKMMEPEDSFDVHIKKLTDAIIALKSEEKKRVDKELAKQSEEKAVKQYALECLARTQAEFKEKILTQVLKAYEWALTNKVTPKTVGEYVTKCSMKFTAIDFTKECAYQHNTREISSADVIRIVSENYSLDANDFVEQYRADLKAKFQFFEADFKHADQALEKARDDHEQQVQNISDDKTDKTIAARLETMAEPMVGVSGVRSLKSVYEVDREKTPDAELVKAFIANANILLPYIKAKTFYDQIAQAIEKHKNKDERFVPSNVTFKTIDKL